MSKMEHNGVTARMVQTRSTASFADYARRVRPEVERALDQYSGTREGCPPDLQEAIRYSLLAPAKRLRPLMVLMAAEACGGSREAALPAACAVEMIHTYSLIHDDLPAMDNDDLRRGRPTNHKVFGEGTAILAGDALLTMAFEVLARDIQPPQTAAACCAALAAAAGPAALVGGQADDLAEKTVTDLAALESIHRRKTGAMFLVSLRLGALAASAEVDQHADQLDEQLTALEAYGRPLGLAFQIMDDLLDATGDEAAVGKRVGKDVDRGKLTFPGLLGIEASRRRAEALVAEACTALAPLGSAAEGLESLARFVLERDR